MAAISEIECNPEKTFELDPYLREVQGQIWDRVNGYKKWMRHIESEGGLAKFAEGYNHFGFHSIPGGQRFTEWLPGAKRVFLTGEFNDWKETHPLIAGEFGRWSIDLLDNDDGTPVVPHKCQHRLRIETHSGEMISRVPAWTRLAWQDKTTNLFNGVHWNPPKDEKYTFKNDRPARPAGLKVYEAHVGMASTEPRVATYRDFIDILPRIKKLGYNAVQLMAIAEHAHYGSFGYHVTSFFAPASRSGTPDELKELVDTAHGMGIVVLMDLVHAHASSNQIDGIAAMDGTDHCYTHGGPKGHHDQWDSSLFDLTKHEVLRFLLSNMKWWLMEYGFDGFRFDGITSLMYNSHGINKGFTGGYHEYFGPDTDIDSCIFLMLGNVLIHEVVPSAITIAEDVSGMPTLCRPVEEGGFGFDYRLAMAIADMWIKQLKEIGDDDWNMGHLCWNLTNRRFKEPCIAYCESHDQAIVGDKSVAFWLMDSEMYHGMSLLKDPSMQVVRGIALHKMIRLLTMGLGGEGYLCFMGNEFGHPEWVDFPREGNGWSHHHCRRRWDLADSDHLRYKHLLAFDIAMGGLDNRFNFLASEHQYVTLKDENSKVIAFERGDCMFIFNFSSTQSYEGFEVGCQWESMRIVLDSDEHRFGGQHRLEYGHVHSFPTGGPLHNRSHSLKLYVPCRTCIVLVRDEILKGNIAIHFSEDFLSKKGLKEGDVTLQMKDGKSCAFAAGKAHIPMDQAEFSVCAAGKSCVMPCTRDEFFTVEHPGDYTLTSLGNLSGGVPELSAMESIARRVASDKNSAEFLAMHKNFVANEHADAVISADDKSLDDKSIPIADVVEHVKNLSESVSQLKIPADNSGYPSAKKDSKEKKVSYKKGMLEKQTTKEKISTADKLKSLFGKGESNSNGELTVETNDTNIVPTKKSLSSSQNGQIESADNNGNVTPKSKSEKVVDDLLNQTVVIKIADTTLLEEPTALVEGHDGASLLDLAMAPIESLKKRAPKLQVLLAQDATIPAAVRQCILCSQTNKNDAILTTKDQILLSPRPVLDAKTKGATQVTAADIATGAGIEFASPGSGGVIAALKQAGKIDELIASGYKYLHVSSVSNVGAHVSEASLAHFALGINVKPALLEVCIRRPGDTDYNIISTKTGFHLQEARPAESLAGQISAADNGSSKEAVGGFTNTNAAWISLAALKHCTNEKDFSMPYTISHCTEKQIALVTPLASAVFAIPGAGLLEVDRKKHYLPVSTAGQLFALRSDAVEVDMDSNNIRIADCRKEDYLPVINFACKAEEYFKDINNMTTTNVPSLVNCTSLRITGKVAFQGEQKISIVGKVELLNDGIVSKSIDNDVVDLSDRSEAPTGSTGPNSTSDRVTPSSSVVQKLRQEHITRCYSGIHMLTPEEEQNDTQSQSSMSIAYQDAISRQQAVVDAFLLEVEPVGGLCEYARGYETRGLKKHADGSWTITEWVANAEEVYVIGDFNSWQRPGVQLLMSPEKDTWTATIPTSAGLEVGSKYKLHIRPKGGEARDQIPAFAYETVFTESTGLMDAVVAEFGANDCPAPVENATKVLSKMHIDGELINIQDQPSAKVYEFHVGMAAAYNNKEGRTDAFSGQISTFEDILGTNILKKVVRDGYNTILLVGVREHLMHSTLGADTSSFFSVCHRIGGMAGLRKFVSAAHSAGLHVLLSISHQGCLSEDGLSAEYFMNGTKSVHPTHATRVFDFDKPEVMKFLLSSLAYFIEVGGVDGFRFEEIPGILYSHFGWDAFLPADMSKREDYFNLKLRQGALLYLTLANLLVHSLRDEHTYTIAEDSSLFPGLCRPVSEGGCGFDARQSASFTNQMHHLADKVKDEDWDVCEILGSVLNDQDLRPAENFMLSTDSLTSTMVSRRPLKIALLSWETLHTIFAGGVAPHVSELGAMLHHAGHEVHVFTRSTQPHSWTHDVWGVQYHEVAYGLDRDFVAEIRNMCSAFVPALLGEEDISGRAFDIIHGHDWLAGPAIEAFNGLGRTTVFTMHSTEYGRCGNEIFQGQSQRIRDIESGGCHSAGRVIAVSGVLSGEVQNFYQTHFEKIRVIYNGIHAGPFLDMDWRDEWVGNTKRDLGIDVMDPMFLFVGRLAVQKGPDLLMDAIPSVLAERPDAKFVIVGDGHLRANCEAKVAQLGIGHAVRFLGAIKAGSDHLKALFRSCDAVVVPSRNEPFGIVVLEAWCAGKPVVATTCGGPRDFVTHDKNGFLVDPTPDSIAWGCKAILSNFEHARWMGIVAQEKAVDSFSWEAIAHQTERVYYEQLNLHDAPARRTKHNAGSLMLKFMGAASEDQMGVLTDNHLVDRAMALQKLSNSCAVALGESFICPMGAEYGNSIVVDVPRPANGFTGNIFDMSLSADKSLRYKHLEFFHACLLRLESYTSFLKQPVNVIVQDKEAQVLVLARGDIVFVMHFSPSASSFPYHIPLDLGYHGATGIERAVLFDSDQLRFGGRRKNARKITPMPKGGFTTQLAARSVLVVAHGESQESLDASGFYEDSVCHIIDADIFISAA